MAHTHIVTDSDAHFVIDPTTRAIKKEESSKTSLIVGDHNSERFSFELPRYIEGHDMSLCNVVRVHYMNTSSSTPGLQSVGIYEVDDFGVLSTDDTKMGLSWLISNKATQYVGKLAFTVQFACMTGFRVDYSWQSGVYSSLSISDGINGSEIVFDEYADILQQWWLKLYASSELPIEILTSKEFEELDGDTEPGVLYILKDDPTLSMLKNHDDKLADHDVTLANHAEQLAIRDNRITKTELDIENHDKAITNNAEQLTTHDNRITKTELDIENHAEEFNSLTAKVEPFYKYYNYTPYVDTRAGDIVNPVASGLWLFKVSYMDGPPVSVIMDTDCEYSCMFTISYVDAQNVTQYRYAALKRVNLDPIRGAFIRLVIYTESENGISEELCSTNEVIYGKRFGFSNRPQ